MKLGDERGAGALVAIGLGAKTPISLIEWLELEARKAEPRCLYFSLRSDLQVESPNGKQIGGRTKIEIDVGAALDHWTLEPIQSPAPVWIDRYIDVY